MLKVRSTTLNRTLVLYVNAHELLFSLLELMDTILQRGSNSTFFCFLLDSVT